MTKTRLDIAIAVFRLSVGGGQERHAVRLANALVARGHRVTLYTTDRHDAGQGVEVTLIRRRGMSNHGQLAAFQDDLAAATRGKHDIVVGVQKMGGLDVLFCGDWCFADRRISAIKRLLPRYRMMAALERACCGPAATTRLLMLAEPQAQAYRKAYEIPAARLDVLPPTLDRRRLIADVSDARRSTARRALGLADGETAWLWLGLQPQVKGLDRVIRALALSPGTRLFACGADPSRRAMRSAMALAKSLGCGNRIVTPGVVDHAALERHLLAADLLVHPARLDVTGTVIIEALAAGLPVIVTANCGYAPHVAASGAGVVVPTDATTEQIAAAAAVDATMRKAWSLAARAYVAGNDLTTGIDVAATIVEDQAARLAERSVLAL